MCSCACCCIGCVPCVSRATLIAVLDRVEICCCKCGHKPNNWLASRYLPPHPRFRWPLTGNIRDAVRVSIVCEVTLPVRPLAHNSLSFSSFTRRQRPTAADYAAPQTRELQQMLVFDCLSAGLRTLPVSYMISAWLDDELAVVGCVARVWGLAGSISYPSGSAMVCRRLRGARNYPLEPLGWTAWRCCCCGCTNAGVRVQQQVRMWPRGSVWWVRVQTTSQSLSCPVDNGKLIMTHLATAMGF